MKQIFMGWSRRYIHMSRRPDCHVIIHKFFIWDEEKLQAAHVTNRNNNYTNEFVWLEAYHFICVQYLNFGEFEETAKQFEKECKIKGKPIPKSQGNAVQDSRALIIQVSLLEWLRSSVNSLYIHLCLYMPWNISTISKSLYRKTLWAHSMTETTRYSLSSGTNASL